MAQLTESLVRSILNGGGFTRGEIEQLCHAWLNTRPAPTEADVLAAAKRAAAANSSIHEGYDLELFWRLLDERAQAHWLKVARAALGVEGGDDGRG